MFIFSLLQKYSQENCKAWRRRILQAEHPQWHGEVCQNGQCHGWDGPHSQPSHEPAAGRRRWSIQLIRYAEWPEDRVALVCWGQWGARRERKENLWYQRHREWRFECSRRFRYRRWRRAGVSSEGRSCMSPTPMRVAPLSSAPDRRCCASHEVVPRRGRRAGLERASTKILWSKPDPARAVQIE